MAYRFFSSSPSSLFHDPPSFSFSFRKPKLRNFPSSPTPLSKTILQSNHVSLQEPIPQQQSKKDANFDNPVTKSSSSKSSHIWVNPKSPRAKQIGKKSHDARYNSLLKLSKSLDSCNPTEDDVSRILKRLGENIIEQDAVMIINNMENSVVVPFVLHLRLNGAEKVFDEMVNRGVKPNNVTFFTIISCARPCLLPPLVYEEIRDMLRKQGKVSARLLQRIRDRVQRWYHEEGYVCAQVVNFGNLITREVVCEVVEGDITNLSIQYLDKLGNVVEGNTEESVVSRELPEQLLPGHTFNIEAGKQALRNINSLALFSNIEVNPRPDEKNERSIIVKIKLKELEQKTAEGSDALVASAQPEAMLSCTDMTLGKFESLPSLIEGGNESLAATKASVGDLVARINESFNASINKGESAFQSSVVTVTNFADSIVKNATTSADNAFSKAFSAVDQTGGLANKKITSFSSEINGVTSKAPSLVIDVLHRSIVAVESSLSTGASYIVYLYGSAKEFLPAEIRETVGVYEDKATQFLRPVGSGTQQIYTAFYSLERSLDFDPNDPIIPFVVFAGSSATLWTIYWL